MDIDNCLKLKVIPQYNGTCWLNAILMASLYSQGCREILKKESKKWDKKNSLLNFFKLILFKLEKYPDKIENLYKKIKPEIILFKIIEETKDKKIIEFIKNHVSKNIKNLGYFDEIFIISFLKYLGIKVLDISYFHEIDKYFIDLIPHLYINTNYKTVLKNSLYTTTKKEIKKIINDIPDVLVVYNSKINLFINDIFAYINDAVVYDDKNVDNHLIDLYNIKSTNIDNYKEIIYFNGIKYILDSVIITNYNHVKMDHSIVGINCNNNKYVYNGWSTLSTDPAIIKKQSFNSYLSPCSLMKFDWNLNKDKSFCLNRKECKLDFNIDPKDLCFSFGQGNRTLIYVRAKDELKKTLITSSSTKEIKKLSNIESVINSIHDIDNLNKEELKKLMFEISLNGIKIDLKKIENSSEDFIRDYAKRKMREYYYYFNNNTSSYEKYKLKNKDFKNINSSSSSLKIIPKIEFENKKSNIFYNKIPIINRKKINSSSQKISIINLKKNKPQKVPILEPIISNKNNKKIKILPKKKKLLLKKY